MFSFVLRRQTFVCHNLLRARALEAKGARQATPIRRSRTVKRCDGDGCARRFAAFARFGRRRWCATVSKRVREGARKCDACRRAPFAGGGALFLCASPPADRLIVTPIASARARADDADRSRRGASCCRRRSRALARFAVSDKFALARARLSLSSRLRSARSRREWRQASARLSRP